MRHLVNSLLQAWSVGTTSIVALGWGAGDGRKKQVSSERKRPGSLGPLPALHHAVNLMHIHDPAGSRPPSFSFSVLTPREQQSLSHLGPSLLSLRLWFLPEVSQGGCSIELQACEKDPEGESGKANLELCPAQLLAALWKPPASCG